MGEAYDQDGRRLGAVTGQTKQDVFEQLNRLFPHAAVITIRSLGGDRAEGTARLSSPIEKMQQEFDADLRQRREKLAGKADR